jgi:hypothetical protein
MHALALARTIAATAAFTALIVLGGASTALAASPSGDGAAVTRYDFDDAWCFDYGTSYDCTVVDATLAVTITPDGRNVARITYRQEVKSFDPSGVQIGSSRTTAFDRTVFADGGQDATFSVAHTRSVGSYGTCLSTYLFKIVDYELQLDRINGPLCR